MAKYLSIIDNAGRATIEEQDAKGLRFGARAVKGPDMVRDVQAVIARKIPLYAVADDLAERGIPTAGDLRHLQPLKTPATEAATSCNAPRCIAR
jgi:hypothetical protein